MPINKMALLHNSKKKKKKEPPYQQEVSKWIIQTPEKAHRVGVSATSFHRRKDTLSWFRSAV